MLAATPIGDPRDAAPRLARRWPSADVVAAEDTRRLRRLTDASASPSAGRVVSYHEHNEATATPELVAALARARGVVLVDRRGDAVGVRPGLPAVVAAVERRASR